MRRDELVELLRRASALTQVDGIVVVGSQSILGSYGEAQLPPRAVLSAEADLLFPRDRDRRRADLVNAVIGELSEVHEELGVYAEGVHRATVVLPRGWRRRTISWHLEPSSTRFLEKHDLCASKLARGAQKDLEFVGVLVEAGLVDAVLLESRCRALEADPAIVDLAVVRARAFRRS